eukprot:scaffold22093_cov145-Isochrysis_galbana.AAC.6
MPFRLPRGHKPYQPLHQQLHSLGDHERPQRRAQALDRAHRQLGRAEDGLPVEQSERRDSKRKYALRACPTIPGQHAAENLVVLA